MFLHSSRVATVVPFTDPVAMELFDTRPRVDQLGSFNHDAGLGLIDPATIVSAYNTVRGIFGGTARDANDIYYVYHNIPQSMIRVTGGSGKWTDTLTGDQINDLGTEVRKSAMLASALGLYVNHDNWFYDDTTGQHIDPAAVGARWKALFGNASFTDAYANYPQLFKTWGSDSSHDPHISSVGKVANAGPLPASERSGAGILGDAPGQIGTVTAGRSGATTTTPVQAGLFGNVSPLALVAIVGAVAFLAMRKRR